MLHSTHARSVRGHNMLDIEEDDDGLSEFEGDDSLQEDFVLFTQKVNYGNGGGLI